MGDLLEPLERAPGAEEALADGAALLRGFARAEASRLWREIERIAADAPFRRMLTPGGKQMSVAMTNCGSAGWVTDRAGYRYEARDPLSGRSWPPMPCDFLALAARAAAAAGYAAFVPDGCLINRYEPGAKMSLHQDKDESDLGQPIVSVSLGLAATFLWGGALRGDRPRRLPLERGDIVIWGGPARLRFHGVEPPVQGDHPLAGSCRINLTFRKAR
jgi:DNA oxidative demethylase